MESYLLDSLSGLQDFAVYFTAAIVFLLFFCRVYSWVTPYDEMKMIREGKVAPAISFGGSLIGFVLPLASAISHSVSLFDMMIWATIALLVQIAVFACLRLVFRELVLEIENNHIAAATLLASLSIAIGVINAASMTY